MESNKKGKACVVVCGDAVIDYYRLDGNYLGWLAGGSIWNMAYWLSSESIFDVYGVVRYCDNELGKAVIHEIENSGIKLVATYACSTRSNKVVFIEAVSLDEQHSKSKMQTICPLCGNKAWTSLSNKPMRFNIDASGYKNRYLVVDSLNKDSRQIIVDKKREGWKIVYDLGWSGYFRYLNANEIFDRISLIDILHINKQFANSIQKRLGIDSTQQLLELFNFELLIITDATENAEVLVKGKSLTIAPDKSIVPIDEVGAGDAFFAGALAAYCEIPENYRCSDITQLDKAQEYANRALSVRGGTGRICFSPVELPCCSKRNNRLERTSTQKHTSLSLKALDKSLSCLGAREEELVRCLDRLETPILCIGLGGSFAAASYISDFLSSRWKKPSLCLELEKLTPSVTEQFKSIVMFSYSGVNKDYENLLLYGRAANQKCLIITKASADYLKKHYSHLPNVTFFSYDNSNSPYNNTFEKGFICFSSFLSPVFLFERFSSTSEHFEDEVQQLFSKWECFWKNVLLKTNLKCPIKMDVVYDYELHSIATDIQCKIQESGIGRVTCYGKTNYKHGGFCTCCNDLPDLFLVLKHRGRSEYFELLSECVDVETLYIELEATCMIDAAIASQVLIVVLSQALDLNPYQPKYDKKWLKLYNLKEGRF